MQSSPEAADHRDEVGAGAGAGAAPARRRSPSARWRRLVPGVRPRSSALPYGGAGEAAPPSLPPPGGTTEALRHGPGVPDPGPALGFTEPRSPPAA